MTLSKRTEIVVAYGLADVCWFIGIVVSIFLTQPYGTTIFWIFGGLGLLCLIHGTHVWGCLTGTTICDERGQMSCAHLFRHLGVAIAVYLAIGLLGTPLWLFAYYLAHRHGI